jgi:hypothetical protein
MNRAPEKKRRASALHIKSIPFDTGMPASKKPGHLEGWPGVRREGEMKKLAGI